MKLCPQCRKPLERVPRSQWLNEDQWDSVKAGDWCCKACPDNGRGQSGLCYWDDKEVDEYEAKLVAEISRS